mgnify:CR=1 FL=1
MLNRGNMRIRDSQSFILRSPKMNERGQVAILIIVAVVIAIAVLAVFLYPRIKVAVSTEVNPSQFLQSCIESDLRNDMALLSQNGGYRAPEGVVNYGGQQYKYLCYTSQFYAKCVVQQPLIKGA